MFASYIENPPNCRFEGQDADEKILLLLRAHPVTNLKWMVPAILLFFLPFFIPQMLSALGINLATIPPSYSLIPLLLNYLLMLAIVFEGFLFWYFNIYLVTDKNVVDIDFHSILFKNIDVAPLRNIEDTSSSMGGILQTIFHFGDVFIQTAGTARNFKFEDVPTPHKVSDFILDLSHKIHGRA